MRFECTVYYYKVLYPKFKAFYMKHMYFFDTEDIAHKREYY